MGLRGYVQSDEYRYHTKQSRGSLNGGEERQVRDVHVRYMVSPMYRRYQEHHFAQADDLLLPFARKALWFLIVIQRFWIFFLLRKNKKQKQETMGQSNFHFPPGPDPSKQKKN